jgi:pimeloyl-ACP methyl ester carboxylesterase
MRACAITAIFVLTGSANAQQQEGFNATDKLAPEFHLTPFYEANLDFAGKKPGDVIKREAIPSPAGAVAWRVMYVSRTWDDRLVPVTGIIVAPEEPGHSRRPIITWEHGTTGTARVSAPSLAPNPAQELVERSATAPIDYGIPYLNDFLQRGFVVVATDYYGLGGPGVHQYLVGATSARNGLDIARAARNLPDLGAGSEVITMGWSQGGHATLFTAEEQPSYAGELIHRGAVAIAPGTTAGIEYVNIPHIYLTMRSYESAYYAPLTGLTPQGRALVDKAADVSVTGVFQESAKLSGPFFTGNWDPTMQKALDMNVPGQRKSPTPILVTQGTKDDVVLPEWTVQLLSRALKAGDLIKVSWYEGATHRSVIEAAKPEILRWIDDRLAGKPAPTDTLPQ